MQLSISNEAVMRKSSDKQQPAPDGRQATWQGMVSARLRAKFRAWNRNRKKLQKLNKSDVVLLRFPKSGVTWLRVMITNVYRGSLGAAGTEIVGRSAFHAEHKGVPNVFVCMDNLGLAKAELEAKLANKKVILLLRDPRDVVISRYFSNAKRNTAVERALIGVPETVEADGPYQFVINPDFGISRIIEFMNYWFAAVQRHPSALIVRYEDLRRDTFAAFSPVMRLLMPEVSDEEIRKAIALADFDRMKAMEASGSFGLDILRPGNEGDTNSFKVRRGKVGGYADYLTEEQKAHVDRIVAETLDPGIGYA